MQRSVVESAHSSVRQRVSCKKQTTEEDLGREHAQRLRISHVLELVTHAGRVDSVVAHDEQPWEWWTPTRRRIRFRWRGMVATASPPWLQRVPDSPCRSRQRVVCTACRVATGAWAQLWSGCNSSEAALTPRAWRVRVSAEPPGGAPPAVRISSWEAGLRARTAPRSRERELTPSPARRSRAGRRAGRPGARVGSRLRA